MFDLATVKDFYPIDEDTLKLRGNVELKNVEVSGRVAQPDKAKGKGQVVFRGVSVEHSSLPRPIKEISLDAAISNDKISIANSKVVSGSNDLKATGTISAFMTGDPSLNLRVSGRVDFEELAEYVPLKPLVDSLAGRGRANLSVVGPVNRPEAFSITGELNVDDLGVASDSLLPKPVSELHGRMLIGKNSANLENLSFNLGSSDILITGRVAEFKNFLDPKGRPVLVSGNYKSKKLDIDELIDWEEPVDSSQLNTEPVPVELPNTRSQLTMTVDTMKLMGVSMTSLFAKASSTENSVKVNEAGADLFDGTARGNLTYNVLRPLRTKVTFEGQVDTVMAEEFFREYQPLGPDSKFHKHITGSFSADATYESELDSLLNPDMKTAQASGTFGMANSRIKDHPVQNAIAELFGDNSLKNLEVDDWQANFEIKDGIFKLDDMNLNSRGMTLELSGTQDLVNDRLSYDVNLYLPQSMASKVRKIVPKRALEAMKEDDGRIKVPLRIKGTSENPRTTVNQDLIEKLLEDLLKDAGKLLRGLFDN